MHLQAVRARVPVPLVLLPLAALLPAAALAADTPSAEQAAMGGAGVADPRDNAGITLNPATVGMVERYDVQAMFLGGPTGDLRWNGSIVDGRTSRFVAFGLGYNGGIIDRPFHPDELPGWAPVQDEPLRKHLQFHDITFAVAAPFLDHKLAVGVNGTLSIFEGDFVESGVTGNLDVGVAAQPIPWLSVGLVGSDLLPIANQADTPATITLGLRGGKEDMIVAAGDVGVQLEHLSGSRVTGGAGVEGSIKIVRLRGGYRWVGALEQHQVTWGLGIFSKVGSIDYAMQVPVGIDETWKNITHTVSLTIRTKFQDKSAEEAPIQWQDDGPRLR